LGSAITLLMKLFIISFAEKPTALERTTILKLLQEEIGSQREGEPHETAIVTEAPTEAHLLASTLHTRLPSLPGFFVAEFVGGIATVRLQHGILVWPTGSQSVG
jgi:hypothetical protein